MPRRGLADGVPAHLQPRRLRGPVAQQAPHGRVSDKACQQAMVLDYVVNPRVRHAGVCQAIPAATVLLECDASTPGLVTRMDGSVSRQAVELAHGVTVARQTTFYKQWQRAVNRAAKPVSIDNSVFGQVCRRIKRLDCILLDVGQQTRPVDP